MTQNENVKKKLWDKGSKRNHAFQCRTPIEKGFFLMELKCNILEKHACKIDQFSGKAI